MGDYDLTFGYDSAANAKTYLAGLGIEDVIEGDPNYYDHKTQIIAGLVSAFEWAATLRVYRATATTFNVVGVSICSKG